MLFRGPRYAILQRATAAASAGIGGIDSYTKLMLHCDGADASTTFTDSSSSARTASVFGNAQIDTAQSKFGGASGLFDGSGDYITFPASSDFSAGTGDFTVDFWVRLASSGLNHLVMSMNASNNFDIFINDISNIVDVYLAAGRYTFSWSPSSATWYHLALARSGTSLKCFIDGTQIDVTKTSSDNISVTSDTLHIGKDAGSPTYLNGWIDEFRVSIGIARWTANFTPPTEAYST